MRRIFTVLLAAIAVQATAAPTSADVDKLFSRWDKADTPGAAVLVVHDGKVVHRKGYGQANLEHNVPITPTTVFHVASISKQFTAFAVLLLAQDGKLSLDDDVRKHLPELQVQGAPITLRHLMHHTSGLRDHWDLVTLAGLRMDDHITEGDLLGLLYQQKQLNFAPGEDQLYSNSGYTLLAQVVRRASGKSLAAFAQERIFEPLGMKDTHFQETYGRIVKNRASSYVRNRDGTYRFVALSFSNTGATSLFTTADDLALWAANHEHMKVGGPAVQEAMRTGTRLADGRPVAYGGGVALEPYRGVPVVEHGGADAGFRSFFLRLPAQKLTVLLLGNAGDMSSGEKAREVADLFLDGMPGVLARRAEPREVELGARELQAYAGDYEVLPGRLLSFQVEQGKLLAIGPGGQRTALVFAGGDQFVGKTSDVTLLFAPTTGNEPSASAMWKQGARDTPLKRLPRETPTAEQLQACTGEYWSEELRTMYQLLVRDGKFAVRYPRGVFDLRAINRNVFAAGYPLGTVLLQRDARGRCEGFQLTTGRVRHLQFQRAKF